MTQTPQQLAVIVRDLRAGDKIRAVFQDDPDSYELVGPTKLYANEFLRVGPLAVRLADKQPASGLVEVQVLERAKTEEELRYEAIDRALRARDPDAMMPTTAENFTEDLAKEGYIIVGAHGDEHAKLESLKRQLRAMTTRPEDTGKECCDV